MRALKKAHPSGAVSNLKFAYKKSPSEGKPGGGLGCRIFEAHQTHFARHRVHYFNRVNAYSSSMYVADWIPFSATVTLYMFTVSGREGDI